MCGIFGIAGSKDAVKEICTGLAHLQHRGQDACGITTFDMETKQVHRVKDTGFVSQVLNEKKIDGMKGSIGIGHTRYPTVGVGDKKEVQPFFSKKPDGISLAFNGNIVNYPSLKKKLEDDERIYFTSNSDAEVILEMFSKAYENSGPEKYFEAARKVQEEAVGGYSVVIMISDKGVLAFKDPSGIRPLCMGEKEIDGKKVVAFCSETTALKMQGYSNISDLGPGEAVFADHQGNIERTVLEKKDPAPCIFEWVYFSSVESVIEGKGVYETRKKLGQMLAEKVKSMPGLDIDLVMPVPDTSRPAAYALAVDLDVPYEEGLIKNRYVARTFIMPAQKVRESAVKLKMRPIESAIKGKKILIVDDSIVRGTTSKLIVSLLRESGAEKVYFASTFPPIVSPCYYGIDFQRKEELIASKKSEDEIAKAIGADQVIYMDVEGLEKSIGTKKMCKGCISGEYPTSLEDSKELSELRMKHLEETSRNC